VEREEGKEREGGRERERGGKDAASIIQSALFRCIIIIPALLGSAISWFG
jgi:hypothetical protein